MKPKTKKPLNIKPLSNIEIIKKLKKKGVNVKFLAYKDLKYINSLDDVMPFILLYQLHEPIGHWVSVFVNDEGLNYYDPLGYVPDKLLKSHFFHPEGREVMNADFTYLNKLMLEWLEDHDQDRIIYNNKPVQPSGSMTCGYHCFTRLLFNDIPNDEFVNYLMSLPVDKREKKVVDYFNK